MNPSKASLLLNPLFILSLTVLLLNDFYWKYTYHNWLTGKLSDFAGLIVLPVFLMELLPRLSKYHAVLFSILFFAWWKSPLSQSLLDVLNSRYNLGLSRVIDCSDFLALIIIPLVFLLKPITYSVHQMLVHVFNCAIGFVTVISLCSTSRPYQSLFIAHPDMPDIFVFETISLEKPASEILKTLQQKRIYFKRDSIMYYPVLNQASLFYKQVVDTTVIWNKVANDSVIYVRREGSPFYHIPLYKFESDWGKMTLTDIRFTLSENNKKTKTKIEIKSFRADGVQQHYLDDKEYKKTYKKLFEDLFQ